MRTLSGIMGLLCMAASGAALVAGPLIDGSAARRSAAWERTAWSTMGRIGEAQEAYKASGGGAYGMLVQLPTDLLVRHDLRAADRDGLMEIRGTLFRVHPNPAGITILGWPMDYGRTGMAAWALRLPGPGLMGTRNTARRYSGRKHAPPAHAADPWPDRAGYGRDGQRWREMDGL